MPSDFPRLCTFAITVPKRELRGSCDRLCTFAITILKRELRGSCDRLCTFAITIPKRELHGSCDRNVGFVAGGGSSVRISLTRFTSVTEGAE
jgi:hypothetical protein